MHDTLRYFQNDPIHRKYHHNDLTFRMLYSFQENFVLPLFPSFSFSAAPPPPPPPPCLFFFLGGGGGGGGGGGH